MCARNAYSIKSGSTRIVQFWFVLKWLRVCDVNNSDQYYQNQTILERTRIIEVVKYNMTKYTVTLKHFFIPSFPCYKLALSLPQK